MLASSSKPRSQQHGEWQRSVESMLRSIEQQLSTASTAMTEAPAETQDESRNLPRAAGENIEKRHLESAYSALVGITGL